MPAYDPRIHHRRSIRLNGYDYSQPGYYYITLVTQGRQCFFGEVFDGLMRLNYAGQMVYKWWCELPNKFQTITLDESIVMPNHFHGIIVIHDAIGGTQTGEGTHVGSRDTHVGVSLLPTVVQWFKTMTTNEYIRGVKSQAWPPFDRKLWQRNYYEHIVRNDHSLDRIRQYIIANPIHWQQDHGYPGLV